MLLYSQRWACKHFNNGHPPRGLTLEPSEDKRIYMSHPHEQEPHPVYFAPVQLELEGGSVPGECGCRAQIYGSASAMGRLVPWAILGNSAHVCKIHLGVICGRGVHVLDWIFGANAPPLSNHHQRGVIQPTTIATY